MKTTHPTPGIASQLDATRVGLLWLAVFAVLVLDIFLGPDLTLLGFLLFPAFFAAIVGSPGQVFALTLGAAACGILYGGRFDLLSDPAYLVRMTAFAITGTLATVLCAARRRAEAESETDRLRLRAMLDSLLDPHVILRAVRDSNGRITDFIFTDANDAACRYNRMSRRQLLGRHLMELLPAHAATGLLDMYRRVIDSGRPLALDDFPYPHEILGEQRYFDIRAVGLGDELTYTWRDVTERHRAAEDLVNRARTDELTQLLNRREIFERLEDLRGKTPRTGHDIAVLFIDFDKFKEINDTRGHAAGDEVMRVTADLIRACLRHDDDLGARVGGDEMMVVLHGVHGLADARGVAEKLRALAAEPVAVSGTPVAATVSIGVALARPDESTQTLVARADEAMYRAKQHGRNQVVVIGNDQSA